LSGTEKLLLKVQIQSKAYSLRPKTKPYTLRPEAYKLNPAPQTAVEGWYTNVAAQHTN